MAGVETTPVRLAPWQITGLAFGPVSALTFLIRLGNRQLIEGSAPTSLLRHARMGNDLLFWSHAAKYVLETLAGQHFLPGLTSDANGRFFALWQPSLLDQELRRRLEMLVDAMPPICRAFNLPSLDAAPAPGLLVEQFIAALVDQAIRRWTSMPSVGGKPILTADVDLSPVGRAATASISTSTRPPALPELDLVDRATPRQQRGRQFPCGF